MKEHLSSGLIAFLAVVALLLYGCTEDPAPDIFFRPGVTASYMNVSFGTVKLTCGISNTNFKECGFWYGTTPNLADKRSVRATMSADGMNAEALLNNLEVGQSYYFQAYIDGGRTIVTSNIGIFTIENVMNVDSSNFILGYPETDIRVTVETNLPLTVDLGGATWIKETKTKGLETYNKVFHISRNTNVESRTATIKITTQNGELSKGITVSQGGSPIDFPDVVFKKYLIANYDMDRDGEIVVTEAKNIESIVVCTDSIESLQGIEYMSNLKSLSCSGSTHVPSSSGKLSSLDVSNNKELCELNCDDNQLTQLDISKNQELDWLRCSSNQLSELDISKNTKLTALYCHSNQLMNLDVSFNMLLRTLYCYNTMMTDLYLAEGQAFKESDWYSGTRVSYVTGQENGHIWVDLGLPSGLKWATCNVGASTPSDYGSYFAWGETSTKNVYTWENYRFRVSGNSDDNVSFSKYNTKSDCGTVDNKMTLETSDDAARANWGGTWRMPTDDEMTELIRQCTWTWTTQDRKSGYLVTSKTNGKSVFLPAAGFYLAHDIFGTGSAGYYWSSSLYSDSPRLARFGHYDSDEVYIFVRGSRFSGQSVRPVTE